MADRFELKFHCETKDLPVYALVIAKNGPKLQESNPERQADDNEPWVLAFAQSEIPAMISGR